MPSLRAHKNKTPSLLGLGVLSNKSLTMTYFHRRTSTIIGAKAFHGPVRDGKAWDHLAMVVKRNWFALWPSCCQPGPKANLKKKHTAPSRASRWADRQGCNVWICVLGTGSRLLHQFV